MEETIRNYKLVREIGKGGMGIVYKALDPTTQKHIAIKVLPPTMVDRTTVERFSREAQAMIKLKHENVVGVLDVGMERGKHYLAMEFIDGESLKALIKRKGRLPLNEAVDIVIQVAQALAYVHQEGIIHRDIKPANIMIAKDGKVKVTDFGLVKIAGVTNLTMEGSAVGTAEYMSPEQVTGQEVDSRTDLYSLGITLYEILAGEPPFRGDTIQAVIMKHKNDPPPPLKEKVPGLPLDFERLMNRALAKNVAHRFQKADELIADLKKTLGMVATEKGLSATKEVASARLEGEGWNKGAGKVPTPRAVPKPQKQKNLPVAGASGKLILTFLVLSAIAGYMYREPLKDFWTEGRIKLDKTMKKKKTARVKAKPPAALNTSGADEHYILGLKYARDGANQQAIDEFKESIRLDSTNSAYYQDLANIYEKMENIPAAVEIWESLIAVDPAGVNAARARQQIERLKLLVP